MAKGAQDDYRMLVAASAKLKADGHAQKHIAVLLNRTESDITRALRQARETGWLAEAPEFHPVDPELWRRAEQRFLTSTTSAAALRARFPEGGRRLNRVTLIHPPPDGIDTQSAAITRELLGDAQLVGVSWGRTLAKLIDAIVPEPGTRRRGPGMRFIPLCGEPMVIANDPSQLSSSTLAARLHERMRRDPQDDPPPSIAGVPAVIPQSFNHAERRIIRRFIAMVRGYEHVFGPADGIVPARQPLVERLDAILTSVGVVAKNERGVFARERVQLGDISEEDLFRAVAGDVGGVLIARADASTQDRKRVEALNAAWTGVTLKHIETCAAAAARRAVPRECPGVILLALGAHRAEIVMRCVELGLVNELVLDRPLEDALARQLQNGPTPQRPIPRLRRQLGLADAPPKPPRRSRAKPP